MLSIDFSQFPVLQTDRLSLRQLSLADAASVQRLRSDVDVMRYINRPLTHTVEDAEAWINMILQALSKNEGITWCISLNEAPAEHVGSIGLWRIEKQNYRAELGYMLQPSLHGKGIIFEALQKVVEFGFHELGLHSIEAQLDPRNVASAALVEKAGFVREAYFRENSYWNGHFSDKAVYSLLAPGS